MRWSIPFLFLTVFELVAAVPQLKDFNLTQFQTNGGIVGVKSGASLTNTAFIGTPTLNGVVTPYGGANYVVYGSTNSTLPNSRVLSAGSNVTITESGTNLTVMAVAGGGTNGIPDPGGNGIVIRTATNTTAYQTIIGVVNETVVTNGDGVLGAPTVALAPKARFLSFTNVAEMEAASVADGTPVILKGYYGEGDAPASLYVFIAGDTSTVDNGSVVTNAAGRFKLQPQGGRVDIRTFGAIADYSDEVDAVWTNNTTALTLSAPLSRSYIGKTVAIRRGRTSIDAALYPLVDVGGQITNFVITNPGQGYINAPTITKNSGPGSGGTFTAVITAGQLTGVTIGGGGGTLYTTNTSIFIVTTADMGSTNAPYWSMSQTVANQVGTAITLTSAPGFSNPQNPTDDLGKAIFYTDNTTFIQNAMNYATNVGVEVFIPAGKFATGPLFVNAKQKIVGAAAENSSLYFVKYPFNGARAGVLMPNNYNPLNARHVFSGLVPDVTISDITVDGNGQWQDPLGVNFGSGIFAQMGVYIAGAIRWHVERVQARNCQGDGIYFGSYTPVAGLFGDWASVQSKRITVSDCTIWKNWRNGSQFGNATEITIQNCIYTNDSYGFYESRTARNWTGNPAPYTDEELDAESNTGATAGWNNIYNTWFTSEYGRGIDFLYDQENTRIVNCTFKNLKDGGITQSAGAVGRAAYDYSWSGDYSLIQGCHFVCTSTNYGAHLSVRNKGLRVIGNTFEGGTGNPSLAVIMADDSAGYPPGYSLDGIIFRDNIFNLYANPGGTVGVVTVTGAGSNIKHFKYDNTVIEGIVDMRHGTDASEAAVEKFLSGSEPYVYGAASMNGKTAFSTAGIGQSDFTVTCKVGLASTGNNGPLIAWGTSGFTEFRLSDKIATSGLFEVLWNPNNTGTRTITVPASAVRNAFSSLNTGQLQRPVNLTVIRKRGSVYAITVTNPGSGYTVAPGVVFTGGGGSSAAAIAQIDAGGTVTNIYITVGGTGYTGTTNPVVSFTGGGGGINAAATCSAARMDIYADDELLYSDFGTDLITPCTTTATTIIPQGPSGTQGARFYSYALWNKSLDDLDLRRYFVYGPASADRWGVWGGAAGCLTWVKFDTGVGQFFEDKSANTLHLWAGADVTHSSPKRAGQFIRTVAVTAAAGATNSLNFSVAAEWVLPANARITSAYVVPKSGAAPTIRIGFDSAITDQLVAPVTLTASTTNYLSLVPAMVYGTTNRPVYLGQIGPATNDVVINYSLDQGGLDGSTIQSGIVTAPGGLGSTSAIAATAIDATGWTNTFGVNAMVYAEGTGLQYTVYNAGGTAVYTNAATVGNASIALQKGGKMIVIAGTGVSGRAVPW